MKDGEFDYLLTALPRQRTALVPALLLAQATYGYVPDRAVEGIAAHLRLTPNDVEGIVTSYPDLRRHPAGEQCGPRMHWRELHVQRQQPSAGCYRVESGHMPRRNHLRWSNHAGRNLVRMATPGRCTFHTSVHCFQAAACSVSLLA